jgi:hypothetical protein
MTMIFAGLSPLIALYHNAPPLDSTGCCLVEKHGAISTLLSVEGIVFNGELSILVLHCSVFNILHTHIQTNLKNLMFP